MESALARHDALAAAIIERHAGILVKHWGEGDSLFAVFARVVAAAAPAHHPAADGYFSAWRGLRVSFQPGCQAGVRRRGANLALPAAAAGVWATILSASLTD